MLLFLLVLAAGALAYYRIAREPRGGEVSSTMRKTLSVTSPAFDDGGFIPPLYTCDGNDIRPPLSVRDIPPAAKSLAVIVEDPDAPAGLWVHWVVWNIPVSGDSVTLEEGKDPGGVQGVGTGGAPKYEGPCPPSGVHRYVFRVFALDHALLLPAGASREDLLAALSGRVLAAGALVGRYARGGK